MKNGFKVFDTDTHVLPAAEVIERYVDPDFRPRLKELEPYRTPMRQSADALIGFRGGEVGTGSRSKRGLVRGRER